jgi:hypothetical protein
MSWYCAADISDVSMTWRILIQGKLRGVHQRKIDHIKSWHKVLWAKSK